jgi:hypothetical protein
MVAATAMDMRARKPLADFNLRLPVCEMKIIQWASLIKIHAITNCHSCCLVAFLKESPQTQACYRRWDLEQVNDHRFDSCWQASIHAGVSHACFPDQCELFFSYVPLMTGWCQPQQVEHRPNLTKRKCMLSRIGIRTAATVATAVGGFGAERIANRHPPEPTPSTSQPPPFPAARGGTGNERLSRQASTIRPDANENPFIQGILNKGENMAKVPGNVGKMAQEAAGMTKEDFQKIRDDTTHQLHVAHGAVSVLTGKAELNSDDIKRMTKAGAKDAWDKLDVTKPIETLKKAGDVAFAASTTSAQGVNEVLDASRERAKAEAVKAAAGAAGVQAVSQGLMMLPFPQAKAAGLGLGLLNAAATGGQFSEILRGAGGAGGNQESAMHQEAIKILSEKGGQGPERNG